MTRRQRNRERRARNGIRRARADQPRVARAPVRKSREINRRLRFTRSRLSMRGMTRRERSRYLMNSAVAWRGGEWWR